MLLKSELKITLPFYKAALSVFFIVLLAFFRGVAYFQEIGVALVQNVPVLAIVFCADTYLIEFRENRWEIFALVPVKTKTQVIYHRYGLQVIYLALLAYIGYWLFYLQKLIPIEGSQVVYYLQFLFACLFQICFWGVLSIYLSNSIGNMFAGMGLSLLLWSFLTSMLGFKVLGNWNIMAFCSRKIEFQNDYHWLLGSLIAAVLTVVMLLTMPITLKRKRRNQNAD